jgi:limonene-1,2-epoxide hydrolase
MTTAARHPFRAAVEAADLEAVVATLAEDVVFRSPVTHTPSRGRDAVIPILRAVFAVFEDFGYEREIGAPDAPDHALVFRARVDDRELEGCDFLHARADGTIDELTVMIRPLSALQAVAEAMKAELIGA